MKCFRTKPRTCIGFDDAFLAALDRFVNRRGITLFNNEVEKNKINDSLLLRGLQCEFIPPRSPNFAAIWEAGMKVVKSHLAKTLGNATLIIKEFKTVQTHTESIVNFRPLFSSSNDPNGPQPITPAHLMLGRPLEPVTKPTYENIATNRLTR